MNRKLHPEVKNALLIIAGLLCSSAAYNLYLIPNNIAAGGFTGGDAGAVLTVDFPPELLAQFDSGQRHGLLSALAADPRPRYQDDPDRVYGMAYAGKNVRFTVQDGTVRVVGVE